MRNELNRHKKSDCIKWIIVFTLISVLIAGMVLGVLELFTPYKPSEWFTGVNNQSDQAAENDEKPKTESKILRASSGVSDDFNEIHATIRAQLNKPIYKRFMNSWTDLSNNGITNYSAFESNSYTSLSCGTFTVRQQTQPVPAKYTYYTFEYYESGLTDVYMVRYDGAVTGKTYNFSFRQSGSFSYDYSFCSLPFAKKFFYCSKTLCEYLAAANAESSYGPGFALTVSDPKYRCIRITNDSVLDQRYVPYFSYGAGTKYYNPFTSEMLSAETSMTYTLKEDTVLFVVNSSNESSINIITPPTPPDSEHKFYGWYTDPDFNNPYLGEAVSGDTQLYARFVPDPVYIYFEGVDGIERMSVAYGTLTEDITLPTPTRVGYTFTGWTTIPDRVIYKNYTLTAGWQIKTYNIVFKNDSGETLYSGTIEYSGTVPFPETPNKTGYTFLGWFDSEDVLFSGSTYSYDSDMTFTAKLEINKYTVTFYVGDEVYNTMEVEYGTRLLTVIEKLAEEEPPLEAVSFSLKSGLTSNNIDTFVVTEEISVNVREKQADKPNGFIETVKSIWQQHKTYIIIGGSVLGGVILLVIVLSIVKRPRKYRR